MSLLKGPRMHLFIMEKDYYLLLRNETDKGKNGFIFIITNKKFWGSDLEWIYEKKFKNFPFPFGNACKWWFNQILCSI